jgi:hypothetical protein
VHTLRYARPEELGVLVDVDDAASLLYAEAGLALSFATRRHEARVAMVLRRSAR